LKKIQGDAGLVIFSVATHGDWLQIISGKRHAAQYVIGNVLVSTQMTQHELAAGLYAPLRIMLYENKAGTATFEYDRPSTLFGQYGNESVTAVAVELDQKIFDALIKAAGGTSLLVVQVPDAAGPYRCRCAASAEPFDDRSHRTRHAEMRLAFPVEGAGRIAPIDPKVSATPWSNRFVFSLMSSRDTHQLLRTRAPQETKMHYRAEYLRKGAAKRCAICDGKFGLIRHYSWRTALCSKKCVDRFRARQKCDLRWYAALQDARPTVALRLAVHETSIGERNPRAISEVLQSRQEDSSTITARFKPRSITQNSSG
jgi:uncharacterized protein (DUF302 family)